ncbi:MAG: hypothetical protein O3A63_02775 [Proteobacteria bacterium]|nr:hypothetical protein [Pseudomonadota bacterium]
MLSLLQLLVVVGGCAWLSVSHDLITVSSLNVTDLLVGLALNTIALCLLGVRLMFVSIGVGLVASVRQFVRLTFQSIFYLFLLPLGLGMETARYVGFRRLCPDAPRRQIVLGVLSDRGVGMVTSVCFAVVAWFGYRKLGVWLAIGSLGFLGVVGTLVFARMVAGVFWQLFKALLISFVVHGLTCSAVYFLCCGLGLILDPWLVTLAISAAVFGAIIPLAIAGVQAGDFVAAGILTYLGVDGVAALTLASVYYLTRLQGALFGAVIEVKRSSLGLVEIWNSREKGF